MTGAYRPLHRGTHGRTMATAQDSSPIASSESSSTGSQSPRENAKDSGPVDMIEMYRGSQFDFQKCFEDCVRIKKQVDATTGRWKNHKPLLQEYAVAQARMMGEFSSLLSTCQAHASLHLHENHNIHGDVKAWRIYLNECSDLMQTNFKLKIQHTDDMEKFKNIPESTTRFEVGQRINSLTTELHKNLNFEKTFVEKLIADGKDFVDLSLNEETPSSEEPKFLVEHLYKLYKMGRNIVQNSMNPQTPLPKHSAILFQNILNLYEIEYAQFLARDTLGLVGSVCLSHKWQQKLNTHAQKETFTRCYRRTIFY